jgi:hypothetical protein
LSGTASTKAGSLFGAKLNDVQLVGLHAVLEGPLQLFSHKRILIRAEIALGSAGAFSVLVDRGQIKKRIPVAVDKILKEPRDFGLGGRVFDVVDEPRQSQNLPLAEELLGLIEFEKLNFLGQGTGQIGLLDAFVVAQLVLAELEHLAVVEPDGKRAYQQQRTQNEP